MSVEIHGMEESLAAIDTLASFGGAKTMRRVALTMGQELRGTFRDQADPWGAQWWPHADATLQKRLRVENSSTQQLIDSGAMYASISNASDATSASVSMDGPAEVHQFGTTNAGRGHKNRIPPRPMFPIGGAHDGPPENWWDAITAPIVAAIGNDQ